MGVHLLDGGFSTQLANHVDISTVEKGDPLWCARFLATNKQAIISTHRDYIKAGCDIIETNSYQASIPGFMDHLGLNHDESVALVQESVKLARKAIQEEKEVNPNVRNVLVAGSIGSYGAFLHDGSEYSGDFMDRVSIEEIVAWHEPKIKALVDAGVDILAIETIPALAEAEALAELLKKFPSTKAWISFSCKDGLHLSYGESFSAAAETVWSKNPEQLLAIGVNCLKPEYVTSLISSANKCIPKVVYPNLGEQWDGTNKKWIGVNDGNCRPLVDYIPEWLEAGASFIGGCCRTTAVNIVEFRKEIDSWLKNRSSC